MTKKVFRTFFASVILLAAFFAQAQAPGYMGRKFTLGYGFYFHPAFSNILMEYSDNPVNIQHEIFAEAVVGKRFALGVSAHFYKYTYNNSEPVRVESFQNIYGTYFSQDDDKPSGNYKISARNFAIYAKAFKRNYLAPWGKYFQFGLVYTHYVAEYRPSEMKVRMESGSSYYNYSDFGNPLQSYQSMDILFGNGRTRVLANKIIVDYGYTMQIISSLKMIVTGVLDEGYYKSGKYIGETSAKRIAAMNRFNFYLKVGYLF